MKPIEVTKAFACHRRCLGWNNGAGTVAAVECLRLNRCPSFCAELLPTLGLVK
jgi:hypothetical protein